MISIIKKEISNNIKNIRGFKTKRKIVVFSVDDYGNVRLASKTARENLAAAGIKGTSRFDNFDSLETEQDLLHLYDTLSTVKDKNGKHAVFTAFALPANIDFDKVIASGYNEYHYELLPHTFTKLGMENTWKIWQEGIDKRLLLPQSHGREHLNLKVFEELLYNKDPQLIKLMENRSYTGIQFKKYPTISYTAAFDFDKFEENEKYKAVISDGLNAFEKVFGYRAVHFNPPGGREHIVLHSTLKECGIKFLDTPFDKKEHQGSGVFKRKFNYMGKTNTEGQTYLIRNVVFEPTEKNIDWVSLAMKQIDTAFKWNKPAVISSHRVNFCGNIEESNRVKGLDALKLLLKKIVEKYPEVEFMPAHELGELMIADKNDIQKLY